MKDGEIDEKLGEIRFVARKLRGIGELLSMAVGDPPLSDEALKGLSDIVLEMAGDIEKYLEATSHSLHARRA